VNIPTPNPNATATDYAVSVPTSITVYAPIATSKSLTVIKPPIVPSLDRRLACTACGASATASCDCGVAYAPAGARAAAAIAAHPEKSDRAIAAEEGIGRETVRRARKSTAPCGAVERIGLDGKTRKLPSKPVEKKNAPAKTPVSVTPAMVPPVTIESLRELVIELAREFGKLRPDLLPHQVPGVLWNRVLNPALATFVRGENQRRRHRIRKDCAARLERADAMERDEGAAA
jgi:hypothetical protein